MHLYERAVLMSVNPPWCYKIFSRLKSLELRKTIPNLPPPFTVYVYCTSSDKHTCLMQNGKDVSLVHAINYKTAIPVGGNISNGHVIGSFICDGFLHNCEMANADIAEQKSLVRREKIFDYANGKEVFGWNIADPVLFDTPKELTQFHVKCKENCEDCAWWLPTRVNADEFDMDCASGFYGYKPLNRPPQSWCYVMPLK